MILIDILDYYNIYNNLFRVCNSLQFIDSELIILTTTEQKVRNNV